MRALWRQTGFRWLFLSQALSTTGDRLVLVALALLVAHESGSPTDLALVVGAKEIAVVACVLAGGVWADRFDRRRLMVSADLVRGVVQSTIAILIVTNELTMAELVAFQIAYGAAEAFFRPAYTGLLPETVPKHLVQAANSATSLTSTAAGFIGPALATTLFIAIGPGAAFAVDAGTFFISAALLTLVHRRRSAPRAPARQALLSEAREGFLALRSRRWVWTTVTAASLFVLLAQGPYTVLGPAVAAASFGTATSWGWVTAAVGLGAALGALVGLRWRPQAPLKAAILCVIPFGGMLTLPALALPLSVVLIGAVIGGVGLALFAVLWETALQQRIPSESLSRVAAYDYLGSYGLLPLGLVAISLLTERFPATTVMAAGGMLAAGVMLLALIPRETRDLRKLEEPGDPSARTDGEVVAIQLVA